MARGAIKPFGVGGAVAIAVGLVATAIQWKYPEYKSLANGMLVLAGLIMFGAIVAAIVRWLTIREYEADHATASPQLPPQQSTQNAPITNTNIPIFAPVFAPNFAESQEQSQRQSISEKKIDTLPSEMEDTDVYVVRAVLSGWGKLHDGEGHQCRVAQVDFHMKPLPNSDVWVEVRTQIVFYDEGYHKLGRVKDGVWRTSHPEDTRVNMPFRRGETKTFVVALDVVGEGLTTYEHGIHNPKTFGIKAFLSPKRMPLSSDTVIAQVRLIGEYFQVIRFDEAYWFKVSRMPELTIEKIEPPLFPRVNL